jgi:hypothetical protein
MQVDNHEAVHDIYEYHLAHTTLFILGNIKINNLLDSHPPFSKKLEWEEAFSFI